LSDYLSCCAAKREVGELSSWEKYLKEKSQRRREKRRRRKKVGTA